jgi:hypothetical protein
MIDAYDYMCDPEAKADFCKTLGISHTRFNEIVDKHANRELVEKKFGEWHVK